MFKLFFYTFFFVSCICNSQTNTSLITIKHANSLSFDSEKSNAKILQGDVIAEHEGSILHCDSALFFEKENVIKASGHILITKGDSITVKGNKLFYDGNSKIATLEQNIVCTEKNMVLTTNFLTFDLKKSVLNYYNGGKIINQQNTLTSKNGHYYSAIKEASFHFDVVLTKPEYKMNCDTLRYKFNTKTAFFLGPSIILSKLDYIYCENGWYDTNNELANFSKNSILVTSQQKLKGDSLIYDRKLKIGKAFKNVTLTDSSKKSIIYGDYAEYKQTKSEAFVTKNALYLRIINNDTLFLVADTIYHIDIDSVNNFLNAFHHVKVFKKDFQAVSDSATLNTKESLLQLFKKPVIWSNKIQATALKINIFFEKNKVKGFKLNDNSFLIQNADTLKNGFFNQLSGKSIEGFLSNDTLRKIIVLVNAEAFYYIKNKNKIIGLNKTTGSEINFLFNKGDIEKVLFKPKTNGIIDPLKDVDVENSKLKGFNWQESKRPKSHFELTIKKK